MLKKITSMLILGTFLSFILPMAASANDSSYQLDVAKQATAKYQDVNNAIDDGYAPEDTYVYVPGKGGMGIHYKNMALIEDNTLNPAAPEALVYAMENGRLQLVALEFVQIAYANTDNGADKWTEGFLPPQGWANPAPLLFGHRFNAPMPGNEPGDPWVYSLHAWIWKCNPKGTFAQFNPDVMPPS